MPGGLMGRCVGGVGESRAWWVRARVRVRVTVRVRATVAVMVRVKVGKG